MNTNLSKMPDDLTLDEFRGENFSFKYPTDGHIVEFKPETIRLIYTEDTTKVRFNVKRWKADEKSAEEICQDVFTTMQGHRDDEFEISPEKLEINQHSVWRCRKRFVDGGTPSLVIDMAFFQSNQDVYHLEFATQPEQYMLFYWIFDLLLSSFSLHDSTQ